MDIGTLVLTRHPGQSVWIGTDYVITVVSLGVLEVWSRAGGIHPADADGVHRLPGRITVSVSSTHSQRVVIRAPKHINIVREELL